MVSGGWLSVVCCRNRSVIVAAWAERTGVARVTQGRAERALAGAVSDDGEAA